MGVRQAATRRSNFLIGTVIAAIPRYSGLGETQWDTVDFKACPWYAAGTFRNLVWRTDTAPGVGNTVTITLRVNRVNTALFVTLSGSDTIASNFTATVAIAAGDLVDFKMTVVGSPNFTGDTETSFEFSGTAPQISAYALALGQLPQSGALQTHLFLASNDWGPASARSIAGTSGNVTKYGFVTSANVGAGRTYTFVIVKNSVVQDGSGGTTNTVATLTTGGNSVSWTGTMPVAAGDLLYLRCTLAGASEVILSAGGVQFTATTDGQSQFEGVAVTSLVGGGATRYNDPQAGPTDGWQASESDVSAHGTRNPFVLNGMYWRTEGGPSAAQMTLRINGADTVYTTSIVGTGNGFVTGAPVSITENDTWAMEWQNAGGLSGGFVRWAFTMVATSDSQQPTNTTEACCCSCPEGGGPGPSPTGPVDPPVVPPDDVDLNFFCSGGGLVPVEASLGDSEVYL